MAVIICSDQGIKRAENINIYLTYIIQQKISLSNKYASGWFSSLIYIRTIYIYIYICIQECRFAIDA